MRKAYSKPYRALVVELECGCQQAVPTAYHRLTKARTSVIYSGLVRRGQACFGQKEHRGAQQVVRLIGTAPVQ